MQDLTLAFLGYMDVSSIVQSGAGVTDPQVKVMSAIPEPATGLLPGAGSLLIAGARRHAQRRLPN
jgi:hypothetical protein